ncbi:NmrA family NAD(P)-binding protein [Acuticoccus kandeliae]|uniref:NmrA family NAD(P)-binding protein n=1 Tax=Acuticoccus kandeliae TaxID=2073160 RepID=UPI001300AFF2|nr:NmrA family NAD(P)-binding protein [Acuticoccus kandeliae]
MILITAATGQVGNAALTGLLAKGISARALVRDPSRHAFPPAVAIIPGGFDDDRALAAACDGVDTLFLAGRDSPESVAQHRRVLAHAERAGVRHIVKLSAIGASPASPVALMREHEEVDRMVTSGPFAWTILQPHLYMQNLLRAADMMRNEGRLVAPMGTARFPVVDTGDVGAAAATVLADPAAHEGRRYALTGPAAHTYAEIAAIFAAVAGREVRYEPVAPAAFEARLLAAGLPDWRAFDLSHIATAYTPADNMVRDELPRLLGRAATALEDFAAANRARVAP